MKIRKAWHKGIAPAAALLVLAGTLKLALVEVENALSARVALAAQGEKLEKALAAAREVERMYEVRYRTGYASLKNWLDAQETRRAAEISVAENRLARLANYVSLYQSLGERLP